MNTQKPRSKLHILVILGAVAAAALAFGLSNGSALATRIFSQIKTDSGSQSATVADAKPLLPTPSAEDNRPAVPMTLPSRAVLPLMPFIAQTLNNCVPATISMALSTFDINVSQEVTRLALRTGHGDKNVFMYEAEEYLQNEHGLGSKLFYNGTDEILKRLLASGYYILIESIFEPGSDIGHNIILRGYDDEKGVFIITDTYAGPTIEMSYEQFAPTWKAFNRDYIPVYKKEDSAKIRDIIGPDYNATNMYRSAIARNKIDVQKDPSDMYAWFNIGTSHYALGEYKEAEKAFDTSRKLGWPKRILWYQPQPVQTYNMVGRYETALELARSGLVANESYPELHYESAVALKGLGRIAEAKKEAEKTLSLDPDFTQATEFLASLE